MARRAWFRPAHGERPLANTLGKYRAMLRLRPLLKYREMVEEEIRRLILQDTDGFRVYKPVHHMLAAGGKYVRPILLLLSCEAVGGDPKRILPGAAGIEMGHVASLIHDDVIDGAQLRRGIASVQERWGVHDAILSGDLLVFHGFQSMARLRGRVPEDRIVRFLDIISRAGITLVVGQEKEADFAARLTMTEAQYLDVVYRKTGALTQAITESGAVLGGGSEAEVTMLSEYGKQLGIAFQVKDDLLSLTKTDEETLKSSTADAKGKIMTLPVIYALRDGHDKEIRALFAQKEVAPGDVERLAGILRDAGALDRAEQKAWALAEKAKAALSDLKASKSKGLLLDLADFVVERPF